MKQNNINKKNSSQNQKEQTKSNKFPGHWIYLILVAFVFLLTQTKVFKAEPDTNGDNATYYISAKSLAQGDGYANILVKEKPLTNNFPPGYPVLMAALMKITPSFTAQKVMNTIFLLMACVLIYFIVFSISKNKILALAAAILPNVNYLLLHFSSMMMSEASFFFFSALAIFAFYKIKPDLNFSQLLKNPFFYLLLFASSYAFHIRTQGVSLFAAFALLFLIQKKWPLLISYFSGFIALALPWIIRNRVNDVPASRYMRQITEANHWRPEEGVLDFGGLINRMWETTQMLIGKAIPDVSLPNYVFNYNDPISTNMWIVGLLCIGLIVLGYIKFAKKNAILFIAYIVFNCGIISLWSAPSGNRYLIGLAPFFQIGLLLGILTVLTFMAHKISKKIPQNAILIILMIFAIPGYTTDIKKVKGINDQPLSPAYENYFTLAKAINKAYPKGDVVVCSRKPSIFFLHSNCYNVQYKNTLNDTLMIEDMLQKDVDYVVYEQLGYSSTNRYLLPVLKKYPKLFRGVSQLKNPYTYLFQFNKERAAEFCRNKKPIDKTVNDNENVVHTK